VIYKHINSWIPVYGVRGQAGIVGLFRIVSCVLRNGDFGGRIIKQEKRGIMAG